MKKMSLASQPCTDCRVWLNVWRPDSPFVISSWTKAAVFSLRCQCPARCHQRAVWWVWYTCVPAMAIVFAAGLQKDLMKVSWVFIFCSACDRRLVIKDERRWASLQWCPPSQTGIGTMFHFAPVNTVAMFTVWSTQDACLSPKSALITICENYI